MRCWTNYGCSLNKSTGDICAILFSLPVRIGFCGSNGSCFFYIEMERRTQYEKEMDEMQRRRLMTDRTRTDSERTLTDTETSHTPGRHGEYYHHRSGSISMYYYIYMQFLFMPIHQLWLYCHCKRRFSQWSLFGSFCELSHSVYIPSE